jgi:hypothetical protein
MKRTFLRTIGIVSILLISRFLVHFFNLDIFPDTPIIGCFVAGTLFLIAVILSGVLSDFKESERIASDLPAAITNLFLYGRYIKTKDEGIVAGMLSHIKALLSTVNSNFRRNEWNREIIHSEIYRITEDLELLKEDNVEVTVINASHTEIMNIMKMLDRIETIMTTQFLPVAYLACYIASGISMILLVFAKMQSYQGLIMVGGASFVLTILILLILDMDNPFEVGKNTVADVDLSQLFELEEHLEKIGRTPSSSNSITRSRISAVPKH